MKERMLDVKIANTSLLYAEAAVSPQTISYRTCVSNMLSLGVAAIPTEYILANDWEEVEG